MLIGQREFEPRPHRQLIKNQLIKHPKGYNKAQQDAFFVVTCDRKKKGFKCVGTHYNTIHYEPYNIQRGVRLPPV